MAKMITVDPARLNAAGSSIESKAKEYERLYKQLYSEVDSMQRAWQGTDNLAYVTQVKGFEEDFNKLKTLMEQYAEFLKVSSKAYSDTQNEVKQQAGRLTN